MCTVIKPPQSLDTLDASPSIFLAGSIDLGLAEDWQATFAEATKDDVVNLLNPRRDQWDASWEQSIGNPMFREQVEWELEGQRRADCIAMYFAPKTKAPVTLLELGLFAASGKVIVGCPEGYWRKGNIEIVCDQYKIPLLPSLDDLIKAVRRSCSQP